MHPIGLGFVLGLWAVMLLTAPILEALLWLLGRLGSALDGAIRLADRLLWPGAGLLVFWFGLLFPICYALDSTLRALMGGR